VHYGPTVEAITARIQSLEGKARALEEGLVMAEIAHAQHSQRTSHGSPSQPTASELAMLRRISHTREELSSIAGRQARLQGELREVSANEAAEVRKGEEERSAALREAMQRAEEEDRRNSMPPSPQV
jgi:hypothetical protein